MKSLFSSPLAILALAICFGLFLPMLMMDGMFMDAVQYTAVGHNMAHGIGSFWYPYFTKDFMSHEQFNFHEQPPLGFGLFAMVFKIFGSSLYVERFYILFTYLINIGITARLWNLLMPGFKKITWLPVLLYTLVPVIFWVYRHNMLENTMSIFILSGVLFSFKAMQAANKQTALAVLAGTFLFLAFMTKGVPGLFPWAVPLVYWVTYRNVSIRKVVWITSLMVVVTMGLLGLLFLFPESAESMRFYLVERLFERVSSAPTVDNRFFIVSDFLQQLILPVLIIIMSLVIYRVRYKKMAEFRNKVFRFCLLIGLCGVLPITLTMVQRGFYITPAYPFVALALSVVIAGPALQLVKAVAEKPRTSRILSGVSVLLLTLILFTTTYLAGKSKRHHDLLHDVYAVGEAIGKSHLIDTSGEIMWYNWSAKSYFMRYFLIDFEVDDFSGAGSGPDKEYVLLYRDHEVDIKGYRKQDLDLRLFNLYKRAE